MNAPINTQTNNDLTIFSTSKRKRGTAIVIGSSIILMAVTVGFSFPVTKYNKIGWVVIIILDVIVSFGVYLYYKKDDAKRAFASAFLRFIYTIFLSIATAQLFLGSNFINQVNSFTVIWGWGLIVFGLHLIVLGSLFKSESKWFNCLVVILLIFAGLGYMTQYIGILLVPNPAQFVATVEPFFLVPAILGEILFALWMIIKGNKKGE